MQVLSTFSEALLEAVSDGVVMTLPDHTATVKAVNRRFTQMFDLNPLESHQVPLEALLERMRIPQKVRRHLAQAWAALDATSGEQTGGDFSMRGVSGLPTDVRWHSVPVRLPDDGMTGALAGNGGRLFVFTDVTAERAAIRLRDELLQRVSHELRTPLTAICGFAQMVLDDEGLSEGTRDYVHLIKSRARGLRLIVDDIVEINRAETGKIELQRTAVSFNEIVRETLNRLQPELDAHAQHIHLTLAEDELPAVHIDVDRITQVIANLVANAIKYGPEGAAIYVQTHHITALSQLPRSAPEDVITPCVMLCVCDQGPGLEKAEVDGVFEPLYRGDLSTSQQIEGAGLGLSVARSLVDLHRGTMWAEAASKRLPGGRFYFTLPTSHS